jgi:hypothetical protein
VLKVEKNNALEEWKNVSVHLALAHE